MNARLCTLRALLAVLCFVGTASPAMSAQPPRATIAGIVQDASGAPQPTVTVILSTTGSDVERRAVTDADGAFIFGGLPSGTYQARVDEPKFSRYLSAPITVEAGERRTIAVALSPIAMPGAPAAEPIAGIPDYAPSPNRWGLDGIRWDPYHRNRLKGDAPIAGHDVFLAMSGVSTTPFEYRQEPEQVALTPEVLVSLELFKGDTSFKPRAWAFRLTPAFNVSYTNQGEPRLVNPLPTVTSGGSSTQVALQEAFVETKVADIGANYDFMSVRVGIQPFTSDFRGFLYRDVNAGVRAFGNWGRNRHQWNVALFDQLDKDPVSGLNRMSRRDQQVFAVNYYHQDFVTPGYTISPSFHASIDHGHASSYYAGFGGDGHWGRLNLTHQFYQAWGHQEGAGVAGGASSAPTKADQARVNAQFAAGEASIDRDWWRLKGTVIVASGDEHPGDHAARGFDAIFDNPNIAGGGLSFWNREGILLPGTLTRLIGRNSLLPSLEPSTRQHTANFINPGLIEYGVGWDADLTVTLSAAVNVNVLQFHHTQPLTALVQQDIGRTIGVDSSAGVRYRPFLNEHVIVTLGVSLLAPSDDFKALVPTDHFFSPFAVLILRY